MINPFRKRDNINEHNDFRYIFRRFEKDYPGFLSIYQNCCRFYIDEYEGMKEAEEEYFYNKKENCTIIYHPTPVNYSARWSCVENIVEVIEQPKKWVYKTIGD